VATTARAAVPARLGELAADEVPASGSIQPGWMRAAVRPHSREVSTSSATITHVGWRRDSVEPGKIANCAPRAPWYSRGARP
jgi:hypothetical protein